MEEATIIQPNIVECPHCAKTFIHNRVNGMALIELVSNIDTRTKIACRLTLNTLEAQYPEGLPKGVKKAVLDGYNDLARAILTLLGYGLDAE